MEEKYCYIITKDFKLYKVKEESISKCFELYISPLAIKYQLDNKNINELLKTLKEELKNDRN